MPAPDSIMALGFRRTPDALELLIEELLDRIVGLHANQRAWRKIGPAQRGGCGCRSEFRLSAKRA